MVCSVHLAAVDAHDLLLGHSHLSHTHTHTVVTMFHHEIPIGCLRSCILKCRNLKSKFALVEVSRVRIRNVFASSCDRVSLRPISSCHHRTKRYCYYPKTLNQQAQMEQNTALLAGKQHGRHHRSGSVYPPRDCRQLLIEDFPAVSGSDGQDDTHARLDCSVITELVCQHLTARVLCHSELLMWGFLILINVPTMGL